MFFMHLRAKTKAIDSEKAKFHKNITADIKRQKLVNKKLGNGITLQLGKATHR